MNNLSLAIHFFLQIAVILVVCRVVGLIARKLFGQPQVVAEMIAGVLLGPSLLGLLLPSVQAWIFPWDPMQKLRDTQSYLFPASQLGLALYMFVVGLEFRGSVMRSQFKTAVAVSMAGMIAPFILGAALAYFMFGDTRFFPATTSRFEAMLFLGASMCITAFPMLARIIHHKGLNGTVMGTVAISAGAIDDATAWCLLAVVLASFDNNPTHALYNVGGALAFVAVAFLVVRPLMARWHKRFVPAGGDLSEAAFAIPVVLLALGAWFTDLIGLHAVFGAFVMGAVMPRESGFSEKVAAKIQPLTVVLLLPLFFTYSGLNTRIGLLDSWSLWGMCGLVFVAATIGKGVACYLAARLAGISNRESLGIGTLMNARGLMELIIINIGLQRGVISGELFAVLVLMAVLTTLMASPIFDRLVGKGFGQT